MKNLKTVTTMKTLRKVLLIAASVFTSFQFAAAQTAPDPFTTIICSGTSKVLTSGEDATAYQWYKDGTIISGATSKTYSATEIGKYVVVAINEHGCASDAAQAVEVFQVPTLSPVITVSNNNSCFATSNQVELTASGMPTNPVNGLSYAYEWRKVGSTTVIGTTATLTLNSVSASGSYTLTIVPSWDGTALSCSETSQPSDIVINQFAAKPTIALNVSNYLSDDEKRAGIVCERNDVTLTASIDTQDPNFTTQVTYQWAKDGVDIAGATNATLNLANITVANSGSYTVKATTTSGCTSTSDATTIDVKVRPSQPVIQY